jgi:hypothetical protein
MVSLTRNGWGKRALVPVLVVVGEGKDLLVNGDPFAHC